MKRITTLIALVFLMTSSALAQQAPVVLSMKERADTVNRLLEERLDTVVPALMNREGIDMWIIAAREYNEDPVIRTMLPATWIAARRRTILVFFNGDSGMERLAVARYDIGSSFASAWDPEEQPDQWARLADIVAERDPERIGINVSSTFALADGMTASERENMLAALDSRFRERVVSAENLAVGWLETRTQSEMEIYPMIVRAGSKHFSRRTFGNGHPTWNYEYRRCGMVVPRPHSRSESHNLVSSISRYSASRQ